MEQPRQIGRVCTSHVGLRTAGNFPTFPNLRTEDGIAGHLLPATSR